MSYRTGKYAVCGRVRASFSPEITQAEAVKGLKPGVGQNIAMRASPTARNVFPYPSFDLPNSFTFISPQSLPLLFNCVISNAVDRVARRMKQVHKHLIN